MLCVLKDIFILTCDDDADETSKSINNSASSDLANATKQNRHIKPNCKLQFMSDGIYVVKFKLEKLGIYELHILIDKKHICQSPYTLRCLEKSKNLGKKTNLIFFV